MVNTNIQNINNKVEIRDILQEPYLELIDNLKNIENNFNILFQAFCGLGKSRVMYKTIFDTPYQLYAFVFPSLALVEQFVNDYINDSNYGFGIMNEEEYDFSVICSTKELNHKDFNNFTCTTSKQNISNFLDSQKIKIICVTYQSLQNLNSVLKQKNIKIDLAIFDEAHNTIGNQIHKYIYHEYQYNRGVFFTATPKNNNNITMFDRDCQEKNMCGERIANVTYLDGLFHGHLNEFEIRAGIIKNDDDNINTMNIYKTIIRNVLLSKNSRVLTYHSFSNSTQQQKGEMEDEDEKENEQIENSINYKTNVKDFVNQKLFKEAFNLVLLEPEFNKDEYKIYKKVTMKGVIANTKNRKKIFEEFQNSPDDEIFVLSSCQVMKEGIDTKNANHVVFVDSKNSISSIIQNIGRMLRISDVTIRPATLTIPCLIDYDKYKNLENETSQDDYIRKSIMKFGDFNNIMNVLTAIQQDDEDYYRLCLIYPNKHFKEEIKRNVKSSGLELDENSKTADISTIYDIPKIVEETIDDYLTRIANQKDCLLELHTNNMGEDNIKYFGGENKQIKERIYYNDEDNTFYKITEKNGGNKKSSKTKRYTKNINFSVDDEFMVLWNINNISDFSQNTSNCLLNFNLSGSRYTFIWCEKLEKVKEFVRQNNRLPSPSTDKDNQDIKTLGKWVSNQKKNYDSEIENCKYIMKNKEIKDKWEEFISEYSDLFTTPEQEWYEKLEEVIEFIRQNNRLPSADKKIYKDNQNIKTLGYWVSNQKKNYDSEIENCKYIMKNKEIKDKWEEFISEYSDLFTTPEQEWYEKLEEVIEFIRQNNRLPSADKKIYKDNQNIKTLGYWVSTQKKNYDSEIENCKQIMKNEEIKDKWEEFISEYSDLFTTPEQEWYEKLEKVREFVRQNNRLPSPSTDKDNQDNKTLGKWVGTQKGNYDSEIENCKDRMKNKEIKDKWEEFISEYSDLFTTPEQEWYEKLEKVREFVRQNNRLPSNRTDKDNQDIKTLGSWVGHQKGNYDSEIENCKQIMKNEDIKEKWEEFMSEYLHLFLRNEQKSKYKLNRIDNSIIKNDSNIDITSIKSNDLNRNNVKTLKTLCDNLGIKYKSRDRKQRLIDLINTYNDVVDNGVEETKGEYNEEINKKMVKNHACEHLWKTVSEDEENVYKECEKCGRKTKASRKGKSVRYNEPNPDKKLLINRWLRDYNSYNEGNAIYLDAQEMKTSNYLIQNGKFKVENLIIPEYNEDVYNENKENEKFGSRVFLGDFLSILKENDLENICLIYADFLGQYRKFVEPLFEYLEENNNKVQIGSIVGFTWSNNGSGDSNERSDILINIGKFLSKNNYEQMNDITDFGYGKGGQMNVMFIRKK